MNVCVLFNLQSVFALSHRSLWWSHLALLSIRWLILKLKYGRMFVCVKWATASYWEWGYFCWVWFVFDLFSRLSWDSLVSIPSLTHSQISFMHVTIFPHHDINVTLTQKQAYCTHTHWATLCINAPRNCQINWDGNTHISRQKHSLSRSATTKRETFLYA